MAIAADGQPNWASKTITTLDEGAIIQWWGQVEPYPLLDYERKTPIQISGTGQAAPGNAYSILLNQCSTTVVRALMAGADPQCKAKITAWLWLNMGSNPAHLIRIPTITPHDVRELVEAVF